MGDLEQENNQFKNYGEAMNPQGCSSDLECSSPSLTEKIKSQKYRAEVESRNLYALNELESLLRANPATARIIELLHQLGL